MTNGKKFKERVRARMASTGESYAAARKHLHENKEDDEHPATSVTLTADEQRLAQTIDDDLAAIMASIKERDEVEPGAIDAMGAKAHALHMSLRARGHEPRHNKHMLKNREVAPTTVEFYRHVHPVKDLLDFICDEHANDDPVDTTIGAAFKIRIFSRRWGHEDTYHVTRTARGWTFGFVSGPVETGPDGLVKGENHTGLFDLFRHDSINYPEALPGYLAYLWDEAAEYGATHADVQAGLEELAAWVSRCEQTSPRGIFKGYK